ncbi:pentatricopeptide repeat-containing protein At3g22690 [Nicotiana sylvestris]|uniref:Pentatricopeptide repeat-containing protein At3g22690 n=1 Tax=Nicotiana sylvestris TaxID=4096 RepID=A0A1U7YTH5_NICSY|nr:PREDICTED: pentatricopeptide repeat-containing protein At3g22690 [Nicotiana sylvestris]
MTATVNLSLSPLLSTPQQPQSNRSTTTDLIKSCKNLNEIKQLHARFTKQGFNQDPGFLGKLIAKCSEIGSYDSLKYAQTAFDYFCYSEEGLNNTYKFNSLIKGYSLAGLFSDAVLIYARMVLENVAPDGYTFPLVLSACAKDGRFFEGSGIQGLALKWGFGDDVFVLNSLIHLYSECGEVDKARKVFDKMPDRNLVSWTCLICGYSRREKAEEAVRLFFEMVEEEGIMPNSVTMVCVISACGELGGLGLAERVCGYIGKAGLKVNTVMVNALVDMYMKCGSVVKAKRLFEECVDRNLVLYNTILSNYVRHGMVTEALDVLGEMLSCGGPRPDRVTLLSAISASTEMADVFLGKQCHAYILRNGLENWDSIGNAIIDMYMKCGCQEWACRVFDRMSNKTVVSWNSLMAGFLRNGDVEAACRTFDEMPESDIVSWNTIIGGLVQQSMFEDAIHLFRVMQNEGIKADRVTMVSVASACGYLGANDIAKWIYNYIEKYEIHLNMQLSTALIDMFARCGDPANAIKVFNKMKERDVSAWTAAIGAMAMEGNGKRAVKLFYEMLREGVEPDQVVFVAVLTACSHGGLVGEGMKIFRTMKEIRGISPQIVHYGCIVDMLGRAGLLKEAIDIIKNMPMKPNDAVWGAFLAACKMHKNDEMATYAADMISESSPDKAGIHVLLSNIYASGGKWTDVAKVRMSMKERGIKKNPGSSSIEVNGTVHEFTSGDESHPEQTSICLMLEEMKCRVREAGHVPDLTNVMMDVDEQEKEFLLYRHSEKIAMAFGLISTSQGYPIRIVKNLRMCSDCHSFAKLVSRVYERHIIVRDNNRFHFFQRGLCSCGDYW